MKTTIYSIVIAIFLSGCTRESRPKYMVGDCVTDNEYDKCLKNRESWEKCQITFIHKIIEVGKHKYDTILFKPDGSNLGEMAMGIEVTDWGYDKTECPLERLE